MVAVEAIPEVVMQDGIENRAEGAAEVEYGYLEDKLRVWYANSVSARIFVSGSTSTSRLSNGKKKRCGTSEIVVASGLGSTSDFGIGGISLDNLACLSSFSPC